MQNSTLRFKTADRNSPIICRWILVLLGFLCLGRNMSSWASGFVKVSQVDSLTPQSIASRYTNDLRIAENPDVLFADDFESWKNDGIEPGTKHWRIRRNKTSQTNVVPGQIQVGGSKGPGQGVLEIACWTEGSGSQVGGLSLKLGNYNLAHEGLGDGYDEIYIRYYIKFDDDYRAVRNHGANLGGRDVQRNNAAWVGMAGIRDVSTRGYFYSGVQPRGTIGSRELEIGFYSYHLDKKGPWGENYEVQKEIPIHVGKWYCIERHLKLNSVNLDQPDPANTDGMEELWIDGQLTIRKTNVRFRRVPHLRITFFSLETYYHGLPKRYSHNQPIKVYFDNVVIATKYIGPMHSESKVDPKKVAPTTKEMDTESRALPPTLPNGKTVATITSTEFLQPPDSLRNVSIAKTPPTVDFLYYPGQNYKGNPWSNWGDGIATRGKYYSSIGDHKAPDGNAFVYEYDPAMRKLKKFVDLRNVLKIPTGQYTPGKIHGRLDMGDDGWLYFSTHRGSTKVTTNQYGYQGDWIIRHNPDTYVSEVIARGPVGKHCIPCSMLDPKRLIFYGGTVAGDITDKRNLFFAYDIRNQQLLYQGYDGPARYMIFSKSTGRIYFTPGLAGQLFRYDPEQSDQPVGLNVKLGIRAATQETPDGFVYAVSKEDAIISRFEPSTEKTEIIGSAPIGTQTYITTIDAGPYGRYLYYVPGAHGGSEKDGSAIVQFDVKTKGKKVIAFLHPCLKQKVGYIPLGTFSTAVSPSGDKLYITWNGNLGDTKRGRPTWDACALTVVHIPRSERLP